MGQPNVPEALPACLYASWDRTNSATVFDEYSKVAALEYAKKPGATVVHSATDVIDVLFNWHSQLNS